MMVSPPSLVRDNGPSPRLDWVSATIGLLFLKYKGILMTLIATVISNQGIIQASDSNLTSSRGPVKTGPKVFRLGFVNGASHSCAS